MAAQIRSSIPAKPTVDNASRDDLTIGDVITLEAVPPAVGTTFQWTLVFVPEGSAAVLTPPAAATTSGPVDFTADLVGPYLARLVVDAGLPTESTQYVRLRALTTLLNLKLVAAGERRDSTGIIPVDVDIEGWANEQNENLLALEAAIGAATAPLSIVLTVGNTTGGTDIEVTTGDSIVGQTSLTMSATAGNVDLTATGAGADIVLNPDAAGAVVVNGKLTVTGLIDPTGLILTEAGIPATTSSEGSLFVANGSTTGLEDNDLYYVKGSQVLSGIGAYINLSATTGISQMLLIPEQLEGDNVGNITGATIFLFDPNNLVSIPSDGAALVLNSGSLTETYTFRTVPTVAFDVEIGTNVRETSENLAAAINTDSDPSDGWVARYSFGTFTRLHTSNINRGYVVLIAARKSVGTHRMYGDEAGGSFGASKPERAQFTPTDWGYQFGIATNAAPLPLADPGTDNFGYRQTGLLQLGDGQLRCTLSPPGTYLFRAFIPTNSSRWYRIAPTCQSYQVDVPPGPNTTVTQRGWAPCGGRISVIRVFMQTVNTQGNYTVVFSKVTGTSPGTLLTTANFDMNTLVAATVTDLPVTTFITRQYFDQGDQWSVEFTSDDLNFDGEGIYFEILFDPEEIQ